MDRGDYLGDPDFNPALPTEADGRPKIRRRLASLHRTQSKPHAHPPTLKRPAGFLPPPPAQLPPAHDTSTADHPLLRRGSLDGNAASKHLHPQRHFFGSGSHRWQRPRRSLINDEMDDFTSKVGVPNMFRLIQGPSQRHRPWQAAALRHDPHHGHSPSPDPGTPLSSASSSAPPAARPSSPPSPTTSSPSSTTTLPSSKPPTPPASTTSTSPTASTSNGPFPTRSPASSSSWATHKPPDGRR